MKVEGKIATVRGQSRWKDRCIDLDRIDLDRKDRIDSDRKDRWKSRFR